MQKFAILALVAGLGLGACGDTLGEQALIGAGGGALAAGAIGGDPMLGAVGGAGVNVLVCQQNPQQCK